MTPSCTTRMSRGTIWLAEGFLVVELNSVHGCHEDFFFSSQEYTGFWKHWWNRAKRKFGTKPSPDIPGTKYHLAFKHIKRIYIPPVTQTLARFLNLNLYSCKSVLAGCGLSSITKVYQTNPIAWEALWSFHLPSGWPNNSINCPALYQSSHRVLKFMYIYTGIHNQ